MNEHQLTLVVDNLLNHMHICNVQIFTYPHSILTHSTYIYIYIYRREGEAVIGKSHFTTPFPSLILVPLSFLAEISPILLLLYSRLPVCGLFIAQPSFHSLSHHLNRGIPSKLTVWEFPHPHRRSFIFFSRCYTYQFPSPSYLFLSPHISCQLLL